MSNKRATLGETFQNEGLEEGLMTLISETEEELTRQTGIEQRGIFSSYLDLGAVVTINDRAITGIDGYEYAWINEGKGILGSLFEILKFASVVKNDDGSLPELEDFECDAYKPKKIHLVASSIQTLFLLNKHFNVLTSECLEMIKALKPFVEKTLNYQTRCAQLDIRRLEAEVSLYQNVQSLLSETEGEV